jgi:hypothetical protein
MAAPPISCVDLLASIDRTNVPFAAFQMNHDVGLSHAARLIHFQGIRRGLLKSSRRENMPER